MSKNITTLDSAPAPTKAVAKNDIMGEVEVLKPASGSADFCGQRATINIAVEPGEGGKNAQFIGVAGTGFLIPRGKSWDVPVEVANAMRDACVTSYQRTADDKSYERVDSPRFSFVAIDGPPVVAEEAAS